MYSRISRLAWTPAWLVCLLGVGCGPGDGRPVLAKVSGTVTYNGKLLAGAAISLLPEQVGIRSATGITDEQGRYSLTTYDPDDGAPVGQCAVAFSLRDPSDRSRIAPTAKSGLGEAYYEHLAGTGKALIPEKYFDPKTSGFTVEVVKGRKNVFDFELKGAAPGKTGK